MFDIGFAELLLIGVVGLLVLGPERMPAAARAIGYWLGRLRRSFNDIRMDIEREINVDEIRQNLHNEAVMKKLEGTAADIDSGLRGAASELKGGLEGAQSDARRELRGASEDFRRGPGGGKDGGGNDGG